MDVTLFTIDEAAAQLRVSRWTVYNLIRSNQLHTIKSAAADSSHPMRLAECVELLGRKPPDDQHRNRRTGRKTGRPQCAPESRAASALTARAPSRHARTAATR